MITYVSFMKPVTIGTFGREEWSLKQDAQTPGHGTIKVTEKGNALIFEYTAGKVKQRVKVPLTNIAQVTEVDDAQEA